MGSAVDAAGLEYQCRELADKGFGGFHVIPTYGAKGYEKQWKGLLSPEWVGAWNLAAELDLGDVREIARVRVNGRDLGCRIMPTYRFRVPPKLLKLGDNCLEVEVTNLGANRLRWNDLNHVNWKYFTDINMVGIDFEHGNKYVKMDASRWQPLKSGLFGPVTLEGVQIGP